MKKNPLVLLVKNNKEFPPPHTCDICNSLDEEFGCMYERREGKCQLD